MAEEYDLVILGGGTGGYVAAIRAAQLGLKTAVVEKEKLGGTCLHKGCIPSKALLRSAEVYRTALRGTEFGVDVKGLELNFLKVQERKNNVVSQLYKGVQFLLKKGKIQVYEGTGRILGPSIFSPVPGTISVEMNDGSDNEMLIPKNVLIATGSRPKSLNGLSVDGKSVLTSDDMLQLEKLPASILIVGGGVIGIEWASMLNDFGVEVTVIEYAKRIIPTEDEEISEEMLKLLKKKGIRFATDAKVLAESFMADEEHVSIQAEINGNKEEFSAEKMLVSVGRAANVEGIGIENTEIEIKDGFISTNDFYQTKETHIYAIGDCIGGLQLAHVASHEGITAVEHMSEKKPEKLDYTLVSKCIYSSPEAASVGLTEKQAVDAGFEVNIGKFPFSAVGKALIHGDADGFVKIIADKKTNDILGVHMIGPHVTDLISEAGLARVLDATPWEVANMIHPHPSLSEAIGEAALAVDGLAIHI